MYFNQRGDISTLNGSSLKLVDKFTYLGSSVSSTEADINMRLAKAWTTIDSLMVIWMSDLTDKIKRSFFQAAVVSILLYGCTTWTLTKRIEKKLDNYTRMQRAILNKSWRQHPTKQQLYGHLPPITKTIQVRRIRHAGHCWRSRDEFISDILLYGHLPPITKTIQVRRTRHAGHCWRSRDEFISDILLYGHLPPITKTIQVRRTRHAGHCWRSRDEFISDILLYGHLPPITKTIQVRRIRHAGHCWRSRDEFISDILLWTPSYGLAKAGRPARTYIQHLCTETGCSLEDLPEAMDDREEGREKVRDICADGMTWWWWMIFGLKSYNERYEQTVMKK